MVGPIQYLVETNCVVMSTGIIVYFPYVTLKVIITQKTVDLLMCLSRNFEF